MKIKYYKAGLASLSLTGKVATNASTTRDVTVGTFKDVNGTERTGLAFEATNNNTVGLNAIKNIQTYKYLTPYASAEAEANFDIEDYEIPSDFTDLTINTTETTTLYGISYVLEVTNNGSEAVTINSFKFVKNLVYFTSTNSGMGSFNALVSVVYLDSPVTIAVGATKTVTVNFSFYNN